eukprot:gnl/TRDRNA2_/TRDRNA2_193360_c0_seq1.p1 gnl/TRDRNA2_/TRDRNA2_193360_c0~~gnl/TRDRNA2_/TRDRNA2_193360_c0_seq1.p1  ORF type:complete len:623 (-),score=220.20 gnl/TRDRNA2_/TRDRNA2_193360_c0_seq1:50-1918(-)
MTSQADPMMAAMGVEEVTTSVNFVTLASYRTESEEFVRLLDAHVHGYTQRRRVLEGLKDLLKRIEAIETKLIRHKAVGKGKSPLEDKEQILYDCHYTDDIKSKIQTLNSSLQNFIEVGKITPVEQPQVKDLLTARLTKAYSDGKEKLAEKMKKSLADLEAVKPVPLPVGGIDELYDLHKQIKAIAVLESKKWHTLEEDEKAKVYEKSDINDQIAAKKKSGQMWFETEAEFQSRLDEALAVAAVQEEEQRKIDAEKAFEQKKLDALKREKEKGDELIRKLEEKRKAAAALPQKPQPEKVKKEKKKVMKLDNNELFVAEDHSMASAPKVEEEYPEEEYEEPAPVVEEKKPAAPVKAPEPKPKPKPKVKRVLQSMWGTPAAENGEESATVSDAPSLADAAKMPKIKYVPPAPPVKKDEREFRKVENQDLLTTKGADTRDITLQLLQEADKENGNPAEDVEHEEDPADGQEEDTVPEPSEDGEPAKAEEEVKPEPAKPKPKPRPVRESQWGSSAPAQSDDAEDAEGGPSLADAMKKAPVKQKQPPPQPKKKGAKKGQKMDLSALGFEFSDAGKPAAPMGTVPKESKWGPVKEPTESKWGAVVEPTDVEGEDADAAQAEADQAEAES